MHNLARGSIDNVGASGGSGAGVQGTHGEPSGGGSEEKKKKKGGEPPGKG